MTSSRRKVLFSGLFFTLIAFATCYFWLNHTNQLEEQTAQLKFLPVPAFSNSRYLNTQPSAQIIGNAACAGCHPRNHESYLLTSHSRALTEINPDVEPPDASFTHVASGRSYRIYRQNGRLHHQETLTNGSGKEIARVDLPIRYRIGSGLRARAYAVEIDGFIHQSPLVWYETKQKWDMSPGYDVANHGSFERPIEMECMACHSGHSEVMGGTLNRLKIVEKSIGCESCHGPGSLHQDFHQKKKLAPGEDDVTIVHPGRLPRPLLESICSSCHLGDPAIVPLRGRQIGDFRPGLPLSDFRIHYRLEGYNESMTVVGHVDQMHQSACYQKSTELSCITCHNPHQNEFLNDKMTFYRDKCLKCHTSQTCKLDLNQRLKQEPRDNCVSCHMPRSDTEVPHVSFTHHRIGIHKKEPPPAQQRIPELVATNEPARLSKLDRDRNLGLAYQIILRHPEYAAYSKPFRDRERTLLQAAYSGGLKDAETLIGLAELYWREDRTRSCEFAQECLEAKDISPKTRSKALMVLANRDFQSGNDEEAVIRLQELTKVRRFSEDWRLLGTIYLRQNQPDKALDALLKSIDIMPYRPDSHSSLAKAYQLVGKPGSFAEHREKAEWLLEFKKE